MNIKHRLYDLAFYSDLKAIRLSLSLGAICIGLGFAWPFIAVVIASLTEFSVNIYYIVLCLFSDGYCSQVVTSYDVETILNKTAIFPTQQQIIDGKGRHTYSLMAQIAPAWAWSAAFILQGSVMLYSLLTNTRSRALFWLDAVFGVIIWTAAIFACYLAYWKGFDRLLEYKPPAIMGGEVAAMLAQWWIFVRYHFDDPKCPFRNRRIRDRREKDLYGRV